MSVLWQEETAQTPPSAPHSSIALLWDMTHSYMGHNLFIWDMRILLPAPHSSLSLCGFRSSVILHALHASEYGT